MLGGDTVMIEMAGRKVLIAAIAVCVAVWSAAVVGAWTAGPASRSVNDGVYTEPQAARGAKVFDTNCTACHDTGRFTGEDFLSAWTGKPLTELFEAVQTMPEDNPGSLKAQEYGDVVAFFLQLNKYPAGSDELKGDAEAMAGIAMAAHP